MIETIEILNMINELANDNLIQNELDYKQINNGQYLAIDFNRIYNILKSRYKNKAILKFSCLNIKKAILKNDYCIGMDNVVKMRDDKTLKPKTRRTLVIDIFESEKMGAKLTNLYLK